MGDLSPHFSRDEFICQCGCGLGWGPNDVSVDLLELLENVRVSVGRPVFITSGCRCLQRNIDSGGVDGSLHMLLPLEAADIRIYHGRHLHAAQKAAYAFGATGVGTGSGFMHIDVHDGTVKPRPATWGY